jgi:cytochrome c biogenesis protein CcmG/thiol:disulfide interchange protein DsbE
VFVLAMMGIVTLVFLAILALLAANRGAEGSMPQIVGHPAPHLDVPLWNGAPGERLDVAALKGGPVVIAFWADGCDACHEEAPVIEAAARRYASTGVRFVGIAYDTNWQDGMRFVREYGITYPCGPDAGDTSARAYGILELPVTLFVNSRGVVVQRIDGEASTRMLDEAIAPLLQ